MTWAEPSDKAVSAESPCPLPLRAQGGDSSREKSALHGGFGSVLGSRAARRRWNPGLLF